MTLRITFTQDDWGRAMLAAELEFALPARVLLFAWLGNDMWWAKSSRCEARHSWTALYHHLADGSRQAIVTCGAVLEHCVLEHCVLPARCEPLASTQVALQFLQPVVLYRSGAHGLGIIAVPQGASKTLRNGIWQLKREYMSACIEPFAAGLSMSRRGHARDFDSGSLASAMQRDAPAPA